jgi:hypothetical protein
VLPGSAILVVALNFLHHGTRSRVAEISIEGGRQRFSRKRLCYGCALIPEGGREEVLPPMLAPPRAASAKPGEQFTQENQKVRMLAHGKIFVPLLWNRAELSQVLRGLGVQPGRN